MKSCLIVLSSSPIKPMIYLNNELGIVFADVKVVNTGLAEVDDEVVADLVVADLRAQLVHVVREFRRRWTCSSKPEQHQY